MKTKKIDLIQQNKVFAYIAAVTLLILSIPFFAMQLTSEVDWKLPDFMIAGLLIFGMGSLFVFVARIINPKFKSIAGIGFLILLLLLWAHLGVGIVDTWPLAGS